jgi:hypothetical protein
MKISGFSIVRQGKTFGYPFEESILSLLPLVDEMQVGVGDGNDGTWEALQRLAKAQPKLKLFRSTWDMSKREGGKVLSLETNKALARCKGDWGIYLQADEVLHEDDLEILRSSLKRHLERRTEGLSFSYLHFYGSYQTLQDHRRKWYRKAIRAVKLGQGVESVGDAYGFKIRGRSLWRADSGARVFHYGWSRPPEVMLRKQQNLDRMYHDEAWIKEHYAKAEAELKRFYDDRGHLKFFRGSHPETMLARASQVDWSFDHQIGRQWPDWMRRIYVLIFFPIVKRLRK